MGMTFARCTIACVCVKCTQASASLGDWSFVAFNDTIVNVTPELESKADACSMTPSPLSSSRLTPCTSQAGMTIRLYLIGGVYPMEGLIICCYCEPYLYRCIRMIECVYTEHISIVFCVYWVAAISLHTVARYWMKRGKRHTHTWGITGNKTTHFFLAIMLRYTVTALLSAFRLICKPRVSSLSSKCLLHRHIGRHGCRQMGA